MNEQTRLTPISRWRERLVRLANDTEWGEHLAYWVGKVAGGLQLRLEKLRPAGEIPWTPLRRPIAQATVAIVTTGGVHLCTDESFDLKTDASFRAIPRSASSADLCITHEHYDRRDALRDLNLMKIESRPLRGKPWEYLFYLDFLGRADSAVAQNALNHLREIADFLRVLGCYPKGA